MFKIETINKEDTNKGWYLMLEDTNKVLMKSLCIQKLRKQKEIYIEEELKKGKYIKSDKIKLKSLRWAIKEYDIFINLNIEVDNIPMTLRINPDLNTEKEIENLKDIGIDVEHLFFITKNMVK